VTRVTRAGMRAKYNYMRSHRSSGRASPNAHSQTARRHHSQRMEPIMATRTIMSTLGLAAGAAALLAIGGATVSLADSNDGGPFHYGAPTTQSAPWNASDYAQGMSRRGAPVRQNSNRPTFSPQDTTTPYPYWGPVIPRGGQG